MEDIVLSDWPGQPVDLNSGNNPWLPAYGFQTPAALLERSDFIGNPDADYFLSGGLDGNSGIGGNFAYLETILEETSDDLRSECSDLDSPVGWLATDSEAGSVICIETQDDDAEYDSDRELACPAKRRKQDYFLSLNNNNTDDDLNSLSRSSSLLQFETLEKQCQLETSSSSPSIYSQFSYDSLETNNNRKNINISPDSLSHEDDFYRTIKIDVARKKTSNDSLLYNATTFSGSESPGSDSDGTMDVSRSLDNLKTWRSFDSLPVVVINKVSGKDKISAENLSEDSGYGDHLTKSSSVNNLKEIPKNVNITPPKSSEKHRGPFGIGFPAYDGEGFHEHFSGNFGVSYQDLSMFKEESPIIRISPLIDHFMKNKKQQQQQILMEASTSSVAATGKAASAIILKLDFGKECASKFKTSSTSQSVPDLLLHRYDSSNRTSAISVCSVPKDLNLIGDYLISGQSVCNNQGESVAAKDWDLTDLHISETYNVLESETVDHFNNKMTHYYKREGSYAEAMANRVDLSDDEHSLYNKKKPILPKTPIVEFDKKVLKAISEQSLQSIPSNSTQHLNNEDDFISTPMEKRNIIASTPNLTAPNQSELVRHVSCFDDEERRKSVQDIRRKNSIIKSSTSTSGLSDNDDRAFSASVKSFNGSTNSKGVHFSPVVSEVNWRDNDSVSTVTPDRESSYSFGSSSPDRRPSPPREIYQQRPPQAQQAPPRAARLGTPARLAFSQPDLSDKDDPCREFVNNLRNLRQQDFSKSQPDVNRMKRRGSQLIKKDKDGSTIKAYVDRDGIQYQHTHLDQGMGFGCGGAHQHQHHHNHQQPTPTTSNNTSSSYRGAAELAGGAGRNNNNYIGHAPPVAAMDASSPHQHQLLRTNNNNVVEEASHAQQQQQRRTTTSTAGKLGGFFSRLASFRFSLRNAAKIIDDKTKKPSSSNGQSTSTAAGKMPLMTSHQRQATKDDYIYIPLKGPSTSSQNNNYKEQVQQSGASSKPPLPRQPPRIVHASVKSGGRPEAGRERRRRTIDSVGGGVRDQMEGSRGRAGLIETDLDTEVTVITSNAASSGASGGGVGAAPMTRSLLDLGPTRSHHRAGAGVGLAPADGTNGQQSGTTRPHKSMEFLLDKQNLRVVEPPENELQKGDRVMSEQQLRVQRSLQKLTVPDWYKQSQVPREGFLLKKTSAPRETRWTGTGSKTTSLSSLGSSTQSPIILSPTPCNQPFVRWSTSKLNSTASSPCASTRSSFNASRQPNGNISPSSVRSSFSYRQPYMGWRSQERLSRPRTPAERLASTLLSNATPTQQQQPSESPEIQSSIKEVTSAIVHYVSGLKPDDVTTTTHSERSRSSSPKGAQKFCWLESSFVGTKPLDSPQTPITLSESQQSSQEPHAAGLRLELQNHNDVTLLMTGSSTMKPSPSSTTLEDVLDSLLGLPSTGRAPSPSLQGTVSANASPCHQGMLQDGFEQLRRRSEGSEPTLASSGIDSSSRRPSTSSTPLLRCRYSRCGKVVLATTAEASFFKNCHNCSYSYCSRACRRAHWEKHRKTCLFSRVGSLCRQVIAAVKEQLDTLAYLSKLARRGYLSHGIGAVKCFFPNPEAAESFLSHGLPYLGELTYVRWQDLLPSEMGPQLYAEIMKMCKTYNPDAKLVLYVSVCVISETPAVGAIKWERQLVSRCAKMRLSKDDQTFESLETYIYASPPVIGDAYTVRQFRARTVENLHSHLRIRGVYLRKQHPEIHRQLMNYTEDVSVNFFPITVFPKDIDTGKSFMCIIMLEAPAKKIREVEDVGINIRTIDLLKDI